MIAPISRRVRRYDVAGYYPNPARAAAGEAFSMAHAGREFKQKPVVQMRTNFSYLARESGSKIMNWGAAVCSYIDALEETGVSVQLDSINEAEPSNREYGDKAPNLSFQFPLKKAEDSLSMASLVFWWAHPSAQRRIAFSGRERLDIERWYGNGYGRTKNVTAPPEGVLQLSIYDAGRDLQENLEIIRRKHLETLSKSQKPQPQLADVVEHFEFG